MKKTAPGRIGSDDTYDKAVKTMVQDATPFLIPLINVMFGKHYTDRAAIRLAGEQGVHTDAKGRRRTLVDIHVTIRENGEEDEYVIEVQSTIDGEIFVRITRYVLGAAMGAIRHRTVNGRKELFVRLPKTGLVYLRAPKNLASPVVLHLEGSRQEGLHEIEVLRMDRMTLDELFSRDLLFLLPFYLFRYADELSAIEQDASRVQALLEEYRDIVKELRRRVGSGELSSVDSSMLAVLTDEVANALAAKQPAIREGVSEAMNSGVLAWRPEDLRQEGLEQGLKQGREQGLKKGLKQGREQGLERGLKQGRDEMAKAFVMKMIRQGFGTDEIMALSPDSISADYVEQLREAEDQCE